MASKFTACSICAHEINSQECPHPRGTPFAAWPPALLERLRRLVPWGWDD